MKLAALAIPGFLKHPAKECHAVLIYGPDEGLVRERADAVAAAITGPTADPFSVTPISSMQMKENPLRLVEELSALSLLGGGARVLRLPEAGDALTKHIEAAYQAVARPEAYLIATAHELPPKSSLRRYFEEQPRCAALPCYALEGKALESRIRQFLEEKGVTTQPDALRLLVEAPGRDWALLQGELEKMALYLAPGEALTPDTAALFLEDDSDAALSRLVAAVADRNLPLLDGLLESNWAEGIVPVTVLRSVSNYFQRLQLVCGQVTHGISLEDAMKKLRPPVFFKEAPVFRRHVQYWKQRPLVKIAGMLLQAERRCKTAPTPLLTQTLCSRCLYAIARA